MPPTINTVNPLALLDTIGESVKAITRRKVQFAEHNGAGNYGYGGGAHYLGADGWSYAIGSSPGGTPDISILAGDPLRNRVVAACVNAKARAMASAPSIIEKLEGGQWKRIDHDAANLLNAPNDYHSYYDVQFATTACEDTKAQGYWRIEFDRSGTPAEIWPEHPDKFRILGTSDKYISGYTFTQEAGGTIDLEDREVIHFRRALDLYNGRLGWTPLFAAYPQIHGDNAAATYQSAILDNAGVMSLLISMKEGVTAGNSVVTSQIEQFVAALKRKLAQRGAGSIAGVNLPLDVNKMGFSPDEMSIPDLIRYFTVSICALLEVDPAMIRMAGGADSPTYANFEVIERDFWHRTVVPTNLQRDATLTTQYLPLWELDPKTHRVNRDYSNIPALQENMAEVSTRVCGEFKVGIIDRHTAKVRLNYEVSEDDKGVYATPGKPEAPTGEEEAPPETEAKSFEFKKYDPRQPRNELGQWTHGSGGTVLYHGTDSATFDAFDESKMGTATDEGLLGRGVYLSTDSNIGRNKRNLLSATVELKKPLHVEYPSWGANKSKLVSDKLGLDTVLSGAALTEELKRRGHDGVVLDYSPIGYDHKEVVVFGADRIKVKGWNTTKSITLNGQGVYLMGDEIKHVHRDDWHLVLSLAKLKGITVDAAEKIMSEELQSHDATKAIDPTDETRPWTDEQLAAATEFTEDDVKFALGSSTPEMRALLRTQPNDKAGE